MRSKKAEEKSTDDIPQSPPESESEPNAQTLQPKSPSKSRTNKGLGIGKGYKYCKECNATIGARAATCPHCKYVYPFKGKKRAKPKTKASPTIMRSPKRQYKHDDVPETPQEQKSPDEAVVFQANYTSFMTMKPNFVDIEPKQKPQLTSDTIDSYINESQLLLNCAYEQMSNLGDLESASKILNRAMTNLTYLATLCDSSDHHPDNFRFPH